jgi:hypothetical protein
MKNYRETYIRKAEIAQVILLQQLYQLKDSRHLFFRGGTALRWCYGGSRFSEDLDFVNPAVCTVLTLQAAVGRSRHIAVGGVTVEFSRIAPRLFTGYEGRDGYNLALPEKALLDTVHLRKNVPFQDEMDLDAIDQDKLARMAEPFPIAVKKRLAAIFK